MARKSKSGRKPKGEKPKNGFWRLVQQEDEWVRVKINVEFKKHGIKPNRLNHWYTVPDNHVIMMPTIMHLIVCNNVPKARKFFSLPDPSVPKLFD